ncbi:hypothetical protein [Pseudonocardia alaniniphila]|uniref:Short subunit dehydrogenase n=1 Tax=Pseudonocardia alaniniphila TaxID=75291 RepID=A0ABS9TEJ9_9PSEU|nr:hypothetical protein [Pseudonocardia alaniniphila]MCH6166731.1 hypothetical protein [Pseudonocardia alaniniphila]
MTALFRTTFGFASTAGEVLAGVDLSGTRAVVTGATSGVGVETSLALVRAGAAVAFLGHFALTVGLHDALARAGGARIVSLSSNAHLACPVIFDDLDHRFRFYDPIGAYGESETADVLLAVEADRRWSGDGIRANAERLWTVASDMVS